MLSIALAEDCVLACSGKLTILAPRFGEPFKHELIKEAGEMAAEQYG